MYSGNFIERMRQIHHELPRGAFPDGTLPCYALYLSDEETDEWIEQQWARYPGRSRVGRATYSPSIKTVPDGMVAAVIEDMQEKRDFSMRAGNGKLVRFVKRGRFWTSRYARSEEVSIAFTLTAAVRDALEFGYRYSVDIGVEYAEYAG